MESAVSWVLGTLLVGALGAIGWMARTLIKHTADIRALEGHEERGDSDIKVWALEKFVARTDYVQQTVLINSKLDSMGGIVTRLDERLATMREG